MISLNTVRYDPYKVKPWALELLDRVAVPAGDPRLGISHPSVAQASVLAVEIAGIQTLSSLEGWIPGATGRAARARAAKHMALEIFRIIPIEPAWAGYAEAINSLADSAEAWAEAQTLRYQLAQAATDTLEDAEELLKEMGEIVTKVGGDIVKAGIPWLWIIGGFLVLRALG